MKCRNCGIEIAEKALICYRCGEATTAPRIAPPPAVVARGPLPLAIAVVILIAVAVMVLPELEPGTPRLAGWAVLVALFGLVGWKLRPRRRQRRG